MKFLLGRKLGMTTLHEGLVSENVTIVSCEPNIVTCVRTPERDGYAAVQVEARKTARKTVRKEFRPPVTSRGKDEAFAVSEVGEVHVGDSLAVSAFEVGDIVDVIGVTKAKGFQGVVKRHGFGGQTTSHGRKHDIRKPGSIGATFPEHVVKGRRMAGRMGGDNFTIRGLRVIFVDAEKGLIALRGAIPGVNGGIVGIRGMGKKVGGK